MSWVGKTALFLGIVVLAAVSLGLRMHLNRFLWVKVWKRYTPEQWEGLSPRPRWLFFVVFFLPLILATAAVVFLSK